MILDKLFNWLFGKQNGVATLPEKEELIDAIEQEMKELDSLQQVIEEKTKSITNGKKE